MDEYCRALTSPDVRFAIFQKEEVTTPHLQGYIEFATRRHLNRVKRTRSLDGAHWEPRKGTAEQAIEYCSKEESRVDGPFEVGKRPSPSQQGKRTDLEIATDLLKQGKTVASLAESCPTVFVKYFRGLNALANTLQAPRSSPPVVWLLVGPPGAGKTRWAYEHAGDADSLWSSPLSGGQWFDGYSNQKYALLDDFAGKMSKFGLTDLLRLLDRYKLLVPIKGGFASWCPSSILITSNYHPREWYDWSSRGKQGLALARRFTYVLEFEEGEEPKQTRRPEGLISNWSGRWKRFWTQ